MTLRATDEMVRDAIDLDADIPTGPAIRTANALVDAISTADTGGLLTSALLVEIEVYLASHFCALRDPQYQTHSTDGASATYQGQTGMGLDLTWWGQQAKRMDITGWLASMDKGRTKATIEWLGLPPSEQTDYEDRD